MINSAEIKTIPQKPSPMANIESVLIGGDLAKLSSADRVLYYKRVCETVGLNPLTKPFDYITLNGKLVLYANKGCAEQLRANRKVSITIPSREVIEGVYVVTANAKLPDGREDAATGAVPIDGLKGDLRANAMMKAETKAKRRATLSICGLNMLDETEVETIKNPHAAKNNQPEENDGIQAPLPACDCGTELKFTSKKSGMFPTGSWYCPNWTNQDQKHVTPVHPDDYQIWKKEIILHTVEQAKLVEEAAMDGQYED
jgi:hypothetical protein